MPSCMMLGISAQGWLCWNSLPPLATRGNNCSSKDGGKDTGKVREILVV